MRAECATDVSMPGNSLPGSTPWKSHCMATIMRGCGDSRVNACAMLGGVSVQPAPALLALSDLHVGYRENRALLEDLRPGSDADWLLVPGDVAERFADIEWALRTLTGRFARVIWAPGNHELWTHGRDEVKLRGEERYRALVDLCRGLGVATPEDPYLVWDGPGGPATIVPMFLLYDYSWWPDGAQSQEQALQLAYDTGVVCSDERLLHPDPWPSREAWCRARVEQTAHRLARLDPDRPVVFVNHFPLVREPTRVLRYPPPPPGGRGAARVAAPPAVRPVVRHRADPRLAPALPRRGGRLRAPAHSPHDLVRRRAVRGGLDRLPAGVAPPGPAAGRPPADPP